MMLKKGLLILASVLVIVACASAAAWSSPSTDPNNSTTRSHSLRLLVSDSADRANAHKLQGADLRGKVAIFTSRPMNVRSIAFFLDDPGMLRRPRQVEYYSPFDLAGTARDGTAKLFDTSSLTSGRHVVTAKAVLTSGMKITSSAAFHKRGKARGSTASQPTTPPQLLEQSTPSSSPSTSTATPTPLTLPPTTTPSMSISPTATTAPVASTAPAATQPATSGATTTAMQSPGTSSSSRSCMGFPDASCTGVPTGTTLHGCPTTITTSGTYDACIFSGDVAVKASNVKITRSQINGQVDAGSGRSGEQTGLMISDSTINCGCLADETHTPSAILESNYTLLRVNIYNAGHGAAVSSNVTIQDSYIHGLGANTDAHKDGIYSGDGDHVLIRHNNIECNDGSKGGCTAAIGILTDFATTSYYTIDNNLLNTNGSYCFYGSGGPQKSYTSNHITVTNNHFGRKNYPKCGYYGPVAYFDSSASGNSWSGNVWDDTGEPVHASY
jgi:hypothetical protein